MTTQSQSSKQNHSKRLLLGGAAFLLTRRFFHLFSMLLQPLFCSFFYFLGSCRSTLPVMGPFSKKKKTQCFCRKITLTHSLSPLPLHTHTHLVNIVCCRQNSGVQVLLIAISPFDPKTVVRLSRRNSQRCHRYIVHSLTQSQRYSKIHHWLVRALCRRHSTTPRLGPLFQMLHLMCFQATCGALRLCPFDVAIVEHEVSKPRQHVAMIHAQLTISCIVAATDETCCG